MTAAVPQPPFISLRWRLLLPIFVGILIVGMLGAYWLGKNLNSAAAAPQTNLILQTSEAIRTRSVQLYEQSRMEAQRVAFTSGVAAAVRARSAADLEPVLQNLAQVAALDSLIVTDTQGIEVIGLLRVEQQNTVSYSVSTDTDLHLESVVRAVLDESYVGATGLARTPQGLLLYTAVPLNDGDERVGIVLLGQQTGNILAELKAYGFADLALYGADGAVLQTTFPPADSALADLNLAPDTFQQTLSLTNQVALSALSLGGQDYQAAYFPFQYGPARLGVLAAIATDNVPAIAQSGQQLTGLVLAAVTGTVIILLFLVVNHRVVGRAGQIRAVASTLASGNPTVRTGLLPTDEIGAVGQALDHYADYVQERQDALRTSLRRQRREAEFLLSVLETIPDGVVVQDQDGQPTVINEQARLLLGSQIEAPLFPDLSAVIAGKLGKSIAPGLYSLGDPRRLERDGRMLSAQAAALMNLSDQRVGTVIVLRDVTLEIRREQAQQTLLQRLADEVQTPLSSIAHASMVAPLTDVARSLSLHSAALQKLIVEMREMTMPEGVQAQEAQRPLYLDTFIWSIANEWRQVAAAANLTLDVLIEKRGLFILGDERRLRWAVGNIVDNAIKYTLPGGKLTLEINGESGNRALMRVRDNGVGIAADDMPYIFVPYYRGTPRVGDGEILHVPGMGQGLSHAKQIIEAHAGLIQLKSKPGVGTAAYFALPLTAAVGYELPLLPAESDLEGETVRLKSKRS